MRSTNTSISTAIDSAETRHHIWFECDTWIHKHKPPDLQPDTGPRHGALDFWPATPPGMTSAEFTLQEWHETPLGVESIAEFLQLNSVVGSFPWLELVDNALDDLQHGKDDSIAILNVATHYSATVSLPRVGSSQF